jgi:multiple sugar transport system permease protein
MAQVEAFTPRTEASRRGRIPRLPLMLLAPTALFALAVTVFPLGYAVVASLQAFRFGRPVAFIGLLNYQNLLADANFRGSVATTLIFTGAATTVEFVLGMALALLLKDDLPLEGIVRSILIIPMIVAPVVVGIVWRLLYSSDVGLVGYVTQLIFGQPVSVLSSPALALPALILVDTWEWTPFMFLILLAGIQSLPQEPFEAARVDGASGWSSFTQLMLPMLRPVIMVAVLIRAIDAFTVFDQVYVLTNGGPGTATEVATLMVYKAAFRFSQIGYGAAMALALLVLVMALSFAIARALRGDAIGEA